MESFTLSERVLGLFGNLSELVKKGLQLVHSPSIDPGFSGGLELGIRNNTGENLELTPGERIGKILFFDVSDTIINAEDFVKNVLKQKQLTERRKAADRIIEVYGELMEGQPPSHD